VIAPIGLFAYNRPEHLARALAALARNPELAASQLVIFCDGPKPAADDAARAKIAATRKAARELAPKARIVEREQNFGLAKSMRTGVSALCDEVGRAIIIEDDLEVSATFLRFMNAALDRYADEPRAMQVSGYMYPVDIRGSDDALWVPSISCWGWGTWARAWAHLGKGTGWYDKLERDPALRRRFDLEDAYPYFEMLQAQHRGEIDSWGIAWNLDVFAADGLVLYPRKSLVANRGHDGSGAHREQSNPFEADAHDFVPAKLPPVGVDDTQYRQLCDYIRRESRGSLSSRVGRLLRKAKVMMSR
jgi:GT2 family glycosyltransferase